MKARSRRGRPCLHKPAKDTGTPELVAKRKLHITSEPLDLCLQKGLVTEEQHAAGIKLRWLHSLQFGVPHVCAYDHAYLGGKALEGNDPKWIAARGKEYKEAIAKLQTIGCRKIVAEVCVFQRWPGFLLGVVMRDYEELAILQEGLTALEVMWRRGS